MGSPLARAAAIALTVVVAAEFVARGPWRAMKHSADLAVHHAATRVWLDGGNPYDMVAVGEAFLAAGGPPARLPTERYMPSVYPPVTFALEAPLALLAWRDAVIALLALSLVLVALALVTLARKLRLEGAQLLAFVLAALALAPLHTGLAFGQVAVPGAALLVLAWVFIRERPVLSGVLFALAAALKPPLVVPLALAALACRPKLRWIATAALVFCSLFAVGAMRLVAAGHSPLHGWWAAVVAASRGMNAPDPGSYGSLTLINLEMLLLRLPLGPLAAKAASFCAAAALGLVALWRLRAGSRREEVYAFSLLCIASLLAFYHRVYDAVLIWIPLAALARDWAVLPRRVRTLATIAAGTFLVPGPVILDHLARTGVAPASLPESWVWRVVLIPHQVWVLAAAGTSLAWLLVTRKLPPAEDAAARAQGDASSGAKRLAAVKAC